MAQFEEMKNEIIKEINGNVGSTEMTFTTEEGDIYKMYHTQDGCETVSIVDVVGDLKDLIGNPILLAEEVVSSDTPEDLDNEPSESFTWTFYKLSTIIGSVTIRWLGESNGYYSESVNFDKIEYKEPWITLPKYGPQEGKHILDALDVIMNIGPYLDQPNALNVETSGGSGLIMRSGDNGQMNMDDATIWTLDDKLIEKLNRFGILRNPCERCLIEVICSKVCEQVDLYNSKCNVIRKNLFDTVEAAKMIFWVILFSGGMALMFLHI